MKISEYVQIIKPSYVFLQVIPNNSVTNNKTDSIARSISSIYKNIFKTIKKEKAQLYKAFGKDFLIGTRYSIQQSPKCSYYIYIEKEKVEFYFIIPETYYSLIREKISHAWEGVTINKVENLPEINGKNYQLVYEKEDGLSLKCDLRDSDLLVSNFNLIDVMEKGEKIGIFYNFIPCSQFSWGKEYETTIHKAKQKKPMERNKLSVGFVFKYTMQIIQSILGVIGELTSGKSEQKVKDEQVELFERALSSLDKVSLSTETLKKGGSPILHTQIAIMSESEKELNQINNLKAMAQSFESITGDNRLITKSLKSVDMLKYSLSLDRNKMSDREVSNFIALPGRGLLERYPIIEKIGTQERQVPAELQKGIMNIGNVTYRGEEQKAYISNDKEYKNLGLILIGPNRSGKTTLMQNLVKNAIDNGECCIIPDYIRNCELAEEIAEIIPSDKVLRIECKDAEHIQGLGYNEVKKKNDPFVDYANAKKQSTQLATLLDSVNDDGENLTPKMKRYLESAAVLAFYYGGSFKTVFNVLLDHKLRENIRGKANNDSNENLKEYASFLEELNEYDKDTGRVIGSKDNLFIGVIDRVNALKRNPYMELMLKKTTSQNIDLVKEMQKAQLIIIKMPESMFSTDSERDTMCTYWLTKLYLSLQIRSEEITDRFKQTKVNLLIDELYQVRYTEKLLKERLSRLAKFNLKPIISCHYLNQLRYLREELRSASASYMLLAGCDRQNFNEFRMELAPFTEEDLLNLKRYHSMNLIKTSDGYARFITKMPTPIKNFTEDRQQSQPTE